VRKMIALRTAPRAADGGDGSDATPLPGAHADDFLEAWLAHGAGGTCWPSSNALYALLRSLGFPARRVAASMRDMGMANHGSIKVALDGRDWLVDSSMQTRDPLPLGDAADGVSGGGDPLFAIEVEPDAGTHVVWHSVPPHDFFPCRLLDDPVDHAFYLAAYERSRGRSPFNAQLYARRNLPGAVVVLRGPTRLLRTAAGTERRELSRDELCAALRDEIGISAALVDAWVASGALEDTFAPPPGPAPPPITTLPPSRRASLGTSS
jgi:arylamine N-acetyltransferase